MSKPRSLMRASALTVAACGLLPAGANATPSNLALADTPLVVSTSVPPNVMLVVDNSGSMEEVIWAPGYDPNVTYPTASFIFSGDGRAYTLSATSTYFYESFGRGSCSSGFREFRTNSGAVRCFKLPVPNGASNTRYNGNYLRYLIANHASGDLTSVLPTGFRMSVARDVARNLVTANPGVRFGLTRFNFSEGGTVVANCGATTTTLNTQIDALVASTWTPLAETLYEVTRYFRGMSSYYNTGTYTSPIQYRCQKNFAIVITDGLPTNDMNFPADDPDDVADTSRSLPNWDNLDPATGTSPPFPKHSDGFKTGSQASEGYSLYLDDIAKFASDIDMRKGGTDLVGGSFDDPRFPEQNLSTYTVGFTVANQMLQDAAEYGQGKYYTANNAEELNEALQRALQDIYSRTTSSSSAAANAGFVSEGTRIYQARFRPEQWAGMLLAFAVDGSPTSPTYGQIVRSGAYTDGAIWDAAELIPGPASRRIFTRGTAGIPFDWANFSAGLGGEQELYFDNSRDKFDFLRGTENAAFRKRSTPLGDIVSSAPVYVGPPNARYPDSLESAPYSAFKTTYKDRASMIYVGANDGMLHGFSAANGVEQMAYIPGVLLPRLKLLADPSYNDAHRYFVDGSPTVVDAFAGGSWRTVLVGGLNKGGQGIYALDVTNPNDFTVSAGNATKLSMWEFTDANDADLGFTYSQPAVVKLPNGVWAAVFGNGYNNTFPDGRVSTTGTAAAYIVNLATGALISKIDLNTGLTADPTGGNRPNGLATLAPVDVDGDFKVDFVYAGDLFGNLWRININAGTSGALTTTSTRIFSACGANACSATNRQPITTRPTVVRHPNGNGTMVFFGTGKYLETSDRLPKTGGLQSFYAIWDKVPTETDATKALVSRSSLLRQEIIVEQNFTFVEAGVSTTHPLRVTTNYKPDWNTHGGWYIDLLSPGMTGDSGERQVTNAVVRNNRVIFTTLIPTDDPCRAGGDSWLMEFDAVSGSRLQFSPFDLNNDGSFSTKDFVTIKVDGKDVSVPVSGRKLEGGAAATPSVMGAEGQNEFKYISTSGGVEVIKENPGTNDTDRQSWRQLGR